MIHGEVYDAKGEGRTRQQANGVARRISSFEFCDHLNRLGSLSGRSFMTAVYKVSSWLATGGFRAELDSSNLLLPYILAGLSEDSVSLGPTGCVCVQDELLISTYRVTQPYRCLDDLARMRHILLNSPAAGEKTAELWYTASRAEYIDHQSGQIQRRLISTNKIIDAFFPQIPFRHKLIIRPLQGMIGLARRVFEKIIRGAAQRYRPMWSVTVG